MTRPPYCHPIRLSDLSDRQATEIELVPERAELDAIAQDLELLGLRKVRLKVRLSPVGKRDWKLTGKLGATVVQPCVATLAPVTTRIDEPVERLYLTKMPQPEAGSEIEMDDDSVEPLGETIDLGAVLTEALALALPLYPRAEEPGAGDISVTEPGKAPLTDEDVKPFAGLASLRDKLQKGE